jgi:hypothetical protein
VDVIDVEIGFNKAIKACKKIVKLGPLEGKCHLPFSETDETAPCMDG